MTQSDTDKMKPLRGANGQAVELLEIGGRIVEVDAEIAPLVRALNAAGLETVASCSGHGYRPADIVLRDGREIIVARDFGEARRINALFPIDINGTRTPNTKAAPLVTDEIAAKEAKWAKWPDGDAGDALDWGLDHAKELGFFLEDWRKDGAQEWPEYHRWLKFQRESALAALKEQGQ
jgi:hypothetical protein